jgi:ribonuclease J
MQVTDELLLLPLGGAGEIGMNMYIYGTGYEDRRKWLVVDCGITFPGPFEPGVDIILPDISFLESKKPDIAGILLTHAHEDHFGALSYLWDRLQAQVYATPFTASLLRAKLASHGGPEAMPVTEVAMQSRFDIGPFGIELVTMSHSIPEPNGVVIRTRAGSLFHTADWKLDPDPMTGDAIDIARIKELGDEGIDAMVCDSTNVFNNKQSYSERDVANNLTRIVAGAKKRVAVTTFASNVGRLRAIAEAAQNAGRHVVVVGRAMWRVIEVARATGYMPADYEFLSEDDYGSLPRNKVLALCTGSQGEGRAALSRIARNDHPRIKLASGDMVLFSSRTIPGNERDVGRIQNQLVEQGIDVLSDGDELIHVSGHPSALELEKLYGWIRPDIAVPMHGEARHLKEHAKLARKFGTREVAEVRNGQMLRLFPGKPKIVDETHAGRMFRDGNLIISAESDIFRQRRQLSGVGVIVVTVALGSDGDIADDPQVFMWGIPEVSENGDSFEDIVLDEIYGVIESLPRKARKDFAKVSEAARRAVRSEIRRIWGKKPVCEVQTILV